MTDDPELDLEAARVAARLHLAVMLRAVDIADASLTEALRELEAARENACAARDALDELVAIAESACRIVAADGDPEVSTAYTVAVRGWVDRMPVL